jgi:anti-sigma28 factor (negative regulator of flagellin synthesis)
MRIDNFNRTPLTQGTERTEPADQQRSSGASGKEAISGADQADVSPLAQALSTHDPARIGELQLAVQSGKYDVAAHAVAGAIIEAHLTE